MKTTDIKIEKLKTAEYNPRKISDKELTSLKKSLTKFGFIQPVVINKDFTVISGHQRIKAWKELGHDDVPTIQLNVSKNEEKALNEKKYRVADTDLTYRQINSLGANEIIKDKRGKKTGWRKFSYKDLVFISIIKELRSFGFIDEKLENLRDLFFKKSEELHSDLAIITAYSGTKTTLIVSWGNNGFEYQFIGFEIKRNKGGRSFIAVNINTIIKDLRKRAVKLNIDFNDIITKQQ